MKATEKAKELVDKLTMDNTRQAERNAIKCALIAVDELIQQENKYNNGTFYPSKYWQQVKQKIEAL